jgi:transposase
MTRLITALSAGVPAALTELRTLGRTLKRRATDILAYFDPLGFRNLTHYIARSLLEAGGFRPQLHPHS